MSEVVKTNEDKLKDANKRLTLQLQLVKATCMEYFDSLINFKTNETLQAQKNHEVLQEIAAKDKEIADLKARVAVLEAPVPLPDNPPIEGELAA